MAGPELEAGPLTKAPGLFSSSCLIRLCLRTGSLCPDTSAHFTATHRTSVHLTSTPSKTRTGFTINPAIHRRKQAQHSRRPAAVSQPLFACISVTLTPTCPHTFVLCLPCSPLSLPEPELDPRFLDSLPDPVSHPTAFSHSPLNSEMQLDGELWGRAASGRQNKCPSLSRSGKVSSLPLSAAKFPQLCKPHGDCECRALMFDPEPPATNPEGHHGAAGDLKTGRGNKSTANPLDWPW